MLRRLQPGGAGQARPAARAGMLKPDEAMSSVGTIDNFLRSQPLHEAASRRSWIKRAVRMSVSVFLLASGVLGPAAVPAGDR